MKILDIEQGRKMRGPRVLVHTVFPYVITRLMKEANLTLRDVHEGTADMGHAIPKSSMHGFMNGVIPESPDVLIVLRKYFSAILKREITTDDLLYGKDEDRVAMKGRIAELEKENKALERQLAFFEIAERM